MQFVLYVTVYSLEEIVNDPILRVTAGLCACPSYVKFVSLKEIEALEMLYLSIVIVFEIVLVKLPVPFSVKV